VNGCTDAALAASDHTQPGDPRAITIPGPGQAPAQKVPACMTVKVGQSVTWNGGFTSHPLEPSGGDQGSPIGLTTTGTTVSFAFSAPGTFGFHCANHPSVMLGAVRVVP
jgi:plastocyanin